MAMWILQSQIILYRLCIKSFGAFYLCRNQWRSQDLREGGAMTFAREARARNF